MRIPFLLIGYAEEPSVYLNQSGVNFKTVMIGRKATEVIKVVNDEKQSFHFAFNAATVEMDSEGVPVLRISPNSGIVEPNSEVKVEVSFLPTTEKFYNFNLSCNVRKKPTPITINIKGEGYKIHDIVEAELLDGTTVKLNAGNDKDFLVDFGAVQINEKRCRKFTLFNGGKFNFSFAWKFSRLINGLGIQPEIGSIQRGEKVACELLFAPNSVISFADINLVCEIQNGKSYNVSVKGSGAKPFLKITPLNLDFGTHFINRGTLSPITKILEISNNDNCEMTVEINSDGETDWIEYEKGLLTLNQGELKQIPFIFYPREPRVFKCTLKVEVNSMQVTEIPVFGEGCDLKIEADLQIINFGVVKIGSNNIKTVKIFNKSKIAAPISLGPNSVISNLTSYGCHFPDFRDLLIKPKSSISIDIKFQPHRRINMFTEEILTEFGGFSRKLFMISGACHGTEVRLENDTLPFGAVFQKSFTSRRLQLQNIGDVGAKFSWDIQKLSPDFSINPREGYILPGMEIPLEVVFQPTEINLDIRANNIPCKIEGMGKLYLTLSGSCIPQASPVEIVKFSTPVRTPETKGILLANRTSMNWLIKPLIDNENWSGPLSIEIESGQSKTYELTFNPAETMGSGEGGKHEGSIFFPLPDGTGLLYKLNGTADKVLPSGNINRELPSKTTLTEILNVSNWLRRPQRLKVVFELSKPDPAILFKGHEFIDLLPLQSKEYKFTYFAYKEGTNNLKVSFKNETTQEFIYFNINYKNLPPGVISTLEIMSPIRQLHTREITISNPLLIPAAFSVSSTNPEISTPHNNFVVQPK